jgi:hypothetical protein
MKLKTVETFDLLHHYDIHVARTASVDTADEAIAFAARRPITLRPEGSPHEAVAQEKHLGDTHAIRHEFDRLLPEPSTPVQLFAQSAVERGVNIAIEGRRDPELGPILVLDVGTHAVERTCPLDEGGALSMLDDFGSKHGVASSAQHRAMLARLLGHASEMFLDAELTSFRLDPIRVHDNTYHVLDAVLDSPRHPHYRKRLAPHAHDEKGYGYNPSGGKV